MHFPLFQKYKIRIIHTFCSLEMAQQRCLLYGLVNSVKIGIEENNGFFSTDQSFTLSLHALSKFHDSYIGHTLGSPHLLFLMSHCLYARHTPPLSLDINSQQENELLLPFLCSRYEHWPEYGRDKDFISLPQEFATKKSLPAQSLLSAHMGNKHSGFVSVASQQSLLKSTFCPELQASLPKIL